jgi:hypothetical protein
MMASNVDACPALDTVLLLARHTAEDGVTRGLPSPFCHATPWEVQFATDIAAKSRRWMLSEPQRALVTKIANGLAERAERRAADATEAKPIPEGRRQVGGTVLTVKEQAFALGHGRHRTTLKMLVQCDGYKLWGTVPSSIAGELGRGDVVTFVATVSRKESGFGLFSRPASAVILSEKVSSGPVQPQWDPAEAEAAAEIEAELHWEAMDPRN